MLKKNVYIDLVVVYDVSIVKVQFDIQVKVHFLVFRC